MPRANDELVPQALSNWRPTVKLSGDVGRSNLFENSALLGATPTQPGTTSPSSGSRHDRSTVVPGVKQTLLTSPEDLSLQVSQPVYRGGRTDAQTKQAEAQVEGRAGASRNRPSRLSC